ncbi:MAG: hypothetical protein JRJ47_12760 [Deltaproteobacteria bacterium]|nr:hypothetical protein [Deltaproteobacteria bacterium]
MKKPQSLWPTRNDRGAAAIIVAIFVLFVGLGVAAFAVDFSFRHLKKNELQNAADAAALAGVRALYYEDYSQVNDDGDAFWGKSANQIAFETARKNYVPNNVADLEILDWASNDGDVQRGHWSFGLPGNTRGFTPNADTDVTDLTLYDANQLDGMVEYINAVRVRCRREVSPVRTFFARIFGADTFPIIEAEAVAYRGLSGSLAPFEVDTIIAICAQSIWEDTNDNGIFDPWGDDPDTLFCNYGRMLNSGGNQDSHNTGGWTNFTQEPCVQPNSSGLREILEVCGGAPAEIKIGIGLGVTGGTVDIVFRELMDCWKQGYYDINGDGNIEEGVDPPVVDGNGVPQYPWTVRLPVIDCDSNNPANCSEVLGGVTVHIPLMLRKENKIDDDAPYKMYNPLTDDFWENSSPDGIVRWNEFVEAFQLQTVSSDPPDDIVLATVYDGEDPATDNDGFRAMSVYFLPDCTPFIPSGGSGGISYGDQSDQPVLVK